MLPTAKYKNNLVALVVDEAHSVKNWLVYTSRIMTHIIVYFMLCRGDDFCVAFAHIDLHSVLPDCVHILALTAIAI